MQLGSLKKAEGVNELKEKSKSTDEKL